MDELFETLTLIQTGKIHKPLPILLFGRDCWNRVIDVVAEGISLALTKRQEFAAIIKANGGNVAPLIDQPRLRLRPAARCAHQILVDKT